MSQIINNPIALPFGILQVVSIEQDQVGKIQITYKYSSYDDLQNPDFVTQLIEPVRKYPEHVIEFEGRPLHRHGTVVLKD